jgi:hypothetical protein
MILLSNVKGYVANVSKVPERDAFLQAAEVRLDNALWLLRQIEVQPG